MPKILFCCKHNRCRSRIAEALAKSHYPSWIIESAGSEPTGDIDPFARTIVQEIHLDITTPAQQVSCLPLETYDLIITLCADEDICPLLPRAIKDRVLHVPFADPSQKSNELALEDLLAHYRDIRNQIDAFCQTLAQHIVNRQGVDDRQALSSDIADC